MQPDVCFLGIPIGTDVRNVRLAREVELPERQTFGTWEVARSGFLGEVLSVCPQLKKTLTLTHRASGRRHLMRLPLEETSVTIGSSHSVNLSSGILDRVEARGVGFSELQSYWSLPFHDFAVVGDVTVMRDKHKRPLYDDIHVVTSNPVVLFSMKVGFF